LTEGFSKITSDSVLADSRIIKTLRYSVAPSISQMKFGQFFGRNTIEDYERAKLSAGTGKHRELAKIAGQIAQFATEHLDSSRFCWVADNSLHSDIAHKYAKMWTCSIAADQNAQTAYRTWRKEQQEQAIVAKLVELGYVKSCFCGIIENYTDINIGEYTQETKVKGRTVQKADVTCRSKHSNKLVLIEAKAVGVELDAVKRIKECSDKANDWASGRGLDSPDVVVVIAGFFTPGNISNLQASNVRVVWEHRLDDLETLDRES
jgi:XamI restriction endonuclease